MAKKPKKKQISLAKLKAKAQVSFNKYIRDRDSEGEYFTCISCGKPLPIKKMQAGHYFPVRGFDHMRFNEDNVSGECQSCNGFNKAHLIGYTWNLIDKIGNKRYDELRKISQIKTKLSYAEVEEILLKYKNT